jgi:anti-sigma B factor antagonist
MSGLIVVEPDLADLDAFCAGLQAESREPRPAREVRIAMPSRIDSNGSQSSSTTFAISQRELDARTGVISIEGELDLSTAPRLKWMLVDALEMGETRLIVDLSLVTFMDSTALGVLVGVARKLEAGARLAVVCVRPNVLKIFEFAGLDGAFAIFSTLEEALVYTRGSDAWTG